jgi:nicotinamidase-related amidase
MARALIVIDVQESFRHTPLWEAVNNPAIVERVSRLVAQARREGDLVVWILHENAARPGPFHPTSGYVRLMDGLEALEGEPVITKTSRNCFTTTNLQQVLVSRGVREVVICGIQTELCCETTARLAFDLGFTVTFVTDATATFPIEAPGSAPGRSLAAILDDPATLGTAEICSRTEYALSGRFAKIASVDELVATA